MLHDSEPCLCDNTSAAGPQDPRLKLRRACQPVQIQSGRPELKKMRRPGRRDLQKITWAARSAGKTRTNPDGEDAQARPWDTSPGRQRTPDPEQRVRYCITWKVPLARDGQDSGQAQSSQVKSAFSYQQVTLGQPGRKPGAKHRASAPSLFRMSRQNPPPGYLQVTSRERPVSSLIIDLAPSSALPPPKRAPYDYRRPAGLPRAGHREDQL
jgi:hypothetical protein